MKTASRSPSLHCDERGIALAIALMAIIVIGALVTGTFFAGRMEMASGRNAVYTAQASEGAEAGLNVLGASWTAAWNGYALDGDSIQATVLPISGNTSVRYTQTVRRMKGGVYRIISQGEKLDRSGNVMASRLLATFAKLVPPWIDVKAAVTAKADVTVSGNATKISGYNTAPTGWSGCTAADSVWGIRTSGTVTTHASPTIQGTPAPTKTNDATVVDSLFQNPYYAMVPLANIILNTTTPGCGSTLSCNGMAPSITGSPSVCNKTRGDNWGEPRRPGDPLGVVTQCTSYFPIIYYPGNLRLQNGRGQGIILVAGDLAIAGNFEFTGIIITLGGVATTGTGNKVTGAILSNDASIGDDDTFAGDPTVQYSQCAIQTVLAGTATGVALTERKWAQINPR
jgi:hypothetical protein